MDAEKLRDIVLNVKQPYLIKNDKIRWNCLDQTFEEWCQSFDDAKQEELVSFSGSTISAGSTQQWERQRTERRMPMSDICKKNPNASNRWNTFSYRNIQELPEECRRGINFSAFGFPEAQDDITFWVGSANAHTPCHYDTYGCNIVVQVYGRKSWILLPPKAKLTPVRVPFEESSVYCKENFYSPESYRQFTDIENEVFHTVLKPGMALVVPPKWWHFVENLEPSLNFNTWLSMESDVDSLISECITKILVQDTCSGLPDELQKQLLNPNEDLESVETSIEKSYEILCYLLNLKQNNKQHCTETKKHPSGYLTTIQLNKVLEECAPAVQAVQRLSQCEFFNIMKNNSLRYDAKYDEAYKTRPAESDAEQFKRIERLVNMCCSPNVVCRIVKAMVG